jgi:hypothetical protein
MTVQAAEGHKVERPPFPVGAPGSNSKPCHAARGVRHLVRDLPPRDRFGPRHSYCFLRTGSGAATADSRAITCAASGMASQAKQSAWSGGTTPFFLQARFYPRRAREQGDSQTRKILNRGISWTAALGAGVLEVCVRSESVQAGQERGMLASICRFEPVDSVSASLSERSRLRGLGRSGYRLATLV